MFNAIQVQMGLLFAQMQDRMETLRDEERGQGLVEYGLILALVAVVAIAGLTALGVNVGAKLTSVANSVK